MACSRFPPLVQIALRATGRVAMLHEDVGSDFEPLLGRELAIFELVDKLSGGVLMRLGLRLYLLRRY